MSLCLLSRTSISVLARKTSDFAMWVFAIPCPESPLMSFSELVRRQHLFHIATWDFQVFRPHVAALYRQSRSSHANRPKKRDLLERTVSAHPSHHWQSSGMFRHSKASTYPFGDLVNMRRSLLSSSALSSASLVHFPFLRNALRRQNQKHPPPIHLTVHSRPTHWLETC